MKRKPVFGEQAVVLRKIFLWICSCLLLRLPQIDGAAGGENHIGRRVVVLGASYGIGRATADLLADRGARVVYAARSRNHLEEAVSGRDDCHALIIDASDLRSIERGMATAALLLGGMDFVLYLPGYFGSDSYGSFDRLFESGDFNRGYEGSLHMHLRGMLCAFEHSRKHLCESPSGCFIAMSSVAGSMGHPGAALYAIAKAAVDAAVQQLALEYAPKGLRVLSVAPGLINTPAIDNLGPERDLFMRQVGASHAMERYAEPDEVAEVIAFLCSERASFMTGGPIFVDGGTMLRSSLGDALRPFTMDGVNKNE